MESFVHKSIQHVWHFRNRLLQDYLCCLTLMVFHNIHTIEGADKLSCNVWTWEQLLICRFVCRIGSG